MSKQKTINVTNIEKSVTSLANNKAFSDPQLTSSLASDRSTAAVNEATSTISSGVDKLGACIVNFDTLLREVATTFTGVDQEMATSIASSGASTTFSSENNKYTAPLKGK